MDYSKLAAPLAQRYATAWQEISNRIQARQNTNIAFIAITFTVSPLLVSSFFRGFLELKSQSNEDKALFLVFYTTASILFSFLPWAYCAWLGHNDKTIGLLSSFCATIEKIDNPNNDQRLPAWHDPRQGIIKMALLERKQASIVTILPIFACSIPSLTCAVVSIEYGQILPFHLGLLLFLSPLWSITQLIWPARYIWSFSKTREASLGISLNPTEHGWVFQKETSKVTATVVTPKYTES